jgi:hypothetical protein
MIAQGHVVAEINPTRQAVLGGAQSLVGAQAADPPPEQWRCFATCVHVAIRGYGLVAYRLAVRCDRYQIGRDLDVARPMYIGLVHAAESGFALPKIDRVLFRLLCSTQTDNLFAWPRLPSSRPLLPANDANASGRNQSLASSLSTLYNRRPDSTTS